MRYLAEPSPLFNSTQKEELFALCPQGLTRSLEMVGLKGFPFEIIAEREEFYEICSPKYFSKAPLFFMKNLLKVGEVYLPQNFSKAELQKRLLALIGTPYIWGGNWHRGFSDLPHSLAGVDCSGLLYEVTEGATPRNSSELLHFGAEVEVEELLPLDLVVWKGHLFIVLNDREAIESKHAWGGVVVTPLKKRLELLREEGCAFSCRRWLPACQN